MEGEEATAETISEEVTLEAAKTLLRMMAGNCWVQSPFEYVRPLSLEFFL